jgi:hypothetical protein
MIIAQVKTIHGCLMRSFLICTLSKEHQGYPVREDDMAEACSMHERDQDSEEYHLLGYEAV